MQIKNLSFPNVMILSGSNAIAGTISKLSKKGMILDTEGNLPCKEEFIMLILYKGQRMAVTLKIIGSVKKDSSPYAVEVLDPPIGYLELVESLEPVSNSYKANISRPGLFKL